MKISELSAGQGNVDVQGKIKELGETRAFNRFGRELRVANAILEDDSGSIKLTLWNDDITKFSEGDSVKITNGYVNEFQGEKQLTSGKFGKIEKAEGGAEEPSAEQEQPPKEEAKPEVEVSEVPEEPKEPATESESEDVKVDETEVESAEGTPDEKPTEEM